MNPVCRVIVMLFMAGAIECNQSAGPDNTGGRLLLENCEDSNNCTSAGGYWYVLSDTGKGGASSVSVMRNTQGAIQPGGDGYQSAVSFRMGCHLSKGSNTYSPWVICGFTMAYAGNELFDAEAYTGLSYFFKGPAHSVRVETGAVTDFCYHSFSVKESDTWKQVIVPFSELSQGFWGKQVEFDKKAVRGVSWQITGNDGDSPTICIDDVYFETDATLFGSGLAEGITIAGSGIDMKADIFRPQGAGPFPCVVILPGGTSASNIGTAYPHHNIFGEWLSAKGFAALVLDYSSVKRTFFDTLQIADIGSAVEYAKKLSYVRSSAVFLAGLSIGGANALRVAGSRTDIAGTICYFAPCDWSIEGKGYGVTKQPIAYCKDISCPVLIFQGDSDRVTDISQSLLLHDSLLAMEKSAELVVYEGAAHGFTYKGAPAGNCVYNEKYAVASFLKVEEFIVKVSSGAER